MTKICVYCGKPFEAHYKNKIYCSERCKGRANYARSCGKPRKAKGDASFFSKSKKCALINEMLTAAKRASKKHKCSCCVWSTYCGKKNNGNEIYICSRRGCEFIKRGSK